MNKIRCAIAGLGRIGSQLETDQKREKPASHAGVINHHQETIICAGCDPDREKQQLFKKSWGVDALYDNIESMLQNEHIDILHIATPPDTHLTLVIAAIQENIPVIILEKPVASTMDEAQQLLTLQKENSAVIIVNHERRYSLQYQRVKEIIDTGYFGRLISIHARLYMGRKRSIRSMFIDDGTHMIDLINFLTGIRLHPISSQRFYNNSTLALCAKSNETLVTMELGALRDHLVFELDLSFECGRVQVGNGYYHEYESITSPYYENYRSLKKRDLSFDHSYYFQNMFKEAVTIFKHGGTPTSSVADGVAALEIIDHILNLN